MSESQTVPTSDVEVKPAKIDRMAYRDIATFEDAINLANESGMKLETASNLLGDGFGLLKEKDALIDRAFLILDWTFTKGDYEDEFVTVRVVTDDNRKLIFNDGSTGIRDQLRVIEPGTSLLVQRGLRKSVYITQVPNKQGELVDTPASTYYLSTDASTEA